MIKKISAININASSGKNIDISFYPLNQLLF
jgi:hypothetical protein